MESVLGPDYDNTHRAFLQALLAHSTLTFEEAQPILAAIFNAAGAHESVLRPEQVTEDDFRRYMDVASDAASLFDYEVRSITHQVTKQRLYALVNTQSDPQTQLATTYSAEELAFIKRLLDGIFDKYNTPRMEVLAVTEMQAIKFARPARHRQSLVDAEDAAQVDRGLKHSEVEAVMRSLVEGGWLEKSHEGFYAATPRVLLELRPWLVETYNDPDAEAGEWQRVKFCEACKDIVTVGLRCAEPNCTLRLHDICQDAFWRTQRSRECPRCQREWTGDRYMGERAVTMTEAYQRGRRRSGGRRSTLADHVIRQEGMEDDAEDDEDSS
ncbi:Nse1 non-SMC component of SMC5-6 complex [Metarhizium rileyi]|uniref:Non-structural maintenance of chromosomes element 1 homolog n=1 Tax=Metarhizium rileyi (strain RCEF 4871) TaxID=1649241 RepID=A0A162JLA5_METRR|nr:Nse1 non-SMC component of SMC5-6 complex [Metarhizium rileyi RCEF 4871]TWU78534.1 hypothetical protein ED733_001950 [Metarhizium rileyi]